jgi:hypothetical protein
MRGRGGNNNNQNQNRKGPNPLTRNYESNGPDVKIRGSAQQIAEKYTTLARDAQSSGDRVMAENYLQHAEHYNRIIMAALAQMPQQQMRDQRDDDDGDDDGDESLAPAQAEQPQQQSRQHHRGEERSGERNDGTGPQPVIEGMPAEVALTQQDEAPARPRATRKREAAQPAAAAETAPAQASENGEQPAGEPVGEEASRRVRRPRRPRVKAGEDAVAEGGESADGEAPVTEAAQ